MALTTSLFFCHLGLAVAPFYYLGHAAGIFYYMGLATGFYHLGLAVGRRPFLLPGPVTGFSYYLSLVSSFLLHMSFGINRILERALFSSAKSIPGCLS